MSEDLIAPLGLLAGFTVAAGKYDNHFWRILLLVAHSYAAAAVVTPSIIATVLYVATAVSILAVPMWANLRFQKRQGCVLVTGCDSGMGQATVLHLAQSNSTAGNQYQQIFAGCFSPEASQKYFDTNLTLEELKYVTVVALDVTKDDSVQQVVQKMEAWREAQTKKHPDQFFGVTGLCMYHGIAFNGPAEYMPIDMYERQIQVNFLGFLRVIQQVLPLMKAHSSPDLPGRIILTGTGGGPMSPCPPLLTAYMASKFATEAYCQALRQELYMTNSNIECLVINPGFVKPTMLMEEGKKLTTRMWQVCESKTGSSKAKDTFGPLMDHFIEYSALQPGTHVSEVCKAAEHGLLAPVPRSSYKVGFDSKVAPIAGMLPTGVRETLTRHGIYGILSPAGTVKGYRV
jgi:NAD(P)-dependent dehydrogenase (short-subunit alcohol dehydrogenase family)